MNHPNLTPEVNRAIAQSEIEGGVFIEKLPVGTVLHVQTKNTLYIIKKVTEKDYLISGHPKYCPVSTEVYIHGSTWGGSMLKVGFIGIGMRMEFSTEHHPGRITTSPIQEITEVQ